MEMLCDKATNTEHSYSTDTKYFLSSEQLEIEKEDILSRVESKIRKHCNELRLQVDVKTESLIEMINRQRDELLNKINEFEFDKIKSAAKYFNEEEGQKLIEGLNKRFNFLSRESKRLEENTIIELGKIYEETNLIVENVFKANLLFFHESLSTELEEKKIIGYLDEISDEVSVLGKLKFVGENEMSYGIKYNEIQDSFVSIQENGLVAVGVKVNINNENNTESKVVVTIYEKSKVKSTIEFKHIRNNFNGFCLNENVFVSIAPYSPFSKTLIDAYDANSFELLKSICISQIAKKVFIHENKIFIIIEVPKGFPLLKVFKENLEPLGSTQLAKAYCLNSSKIFMGCDKIFIQKDNIINIINENKGFFQEDFKIEDSFEIISISNKTSEIITYSSEKRIIRVYKLDGTVVGELNVSHFCQIDSICMNGHGQVVFNVKKKLKLYSN